MRRLSLLVSLFFLPLITSAAEVIRPKVVVVTMFEPGKDTGDSPGEFQFWVEREKLTEVHAFPQGYRDLRTNAQR